MEFLFFICFPMITLFLGLAGGYIYGSKTATEALRPVADELNRRIDSEVMNLNQELTNSNLRLDSELRNVYETVSGLEISVDNLEDGLGQLQLASTVQNNLNKAASKTSKSRGRRKRNK